MRELTIEEEKSVQAGEAITIATIMAILAIGAMAVICFRMFLSNKGKATFPGGFQFTWGE